MIDNVALGKNRLASTINNCGMLVLKVSPNVKILYRSFKSSILLRSDFNLNTI